MLSYKGIISKCDFVSELKKHQKADRFLRGTYGTGRGDDFRGCAVGCSLESIARIKNVGLDYGDHSRYEDLLGIPEWLARLEDTLFENVPVERSNTWPVEFAQSIPVGVDLEPVRAKFIVMLLKHSLKSVAKVQYDKQANPQVTAAIEQTNAAVKQMIKAQRLGDQAAIVATRSAAWSAESAAWSAASATRSAASATRGAASATRSAAWSAAWSAAESAAWSATFNYYADQLLKMLRATKRKK